MSHWISFLFLLSGVLVGNAISPVRISLSETVARVGSNVTVTCKILATTLTEVNIFKFVKAAAKDEDEVLREVISTQTALENPYRSSGRFSVSSTTEGNDKVYVLHITNVQHEDTGYYVCVVMETQFKDVGNLEIYKPPVELSFVNYNESDVIELIEDVVVVRDLRCVASFVSPQPAMTVTAADRDVTGEFLIEHPVNILCQNTGSVGKTCLLHNNFNVSASSHGFKAIYSDDGQKLVCRTNMTHFDRDVMETSLTMHVRHKPWISCVRERWFAILGGINVRIYCIVVSNPPVTDSFNKTWIVFRGTDREGFVPSRSQTAEFTSEEAFIDTDMKKSNITLTITHALKDFFRDYTLRVTNELGTSEQTVNLLMAQSDPNGAPCPRTSGSLYHLILLMTSFQLVLRHLRAAL